MNVVFGLRKKSFKRKNSGFVRIGEMCEKYFRFFELKDQRMIV